MVRRTQWWTSFSRKRWRSSGSTSSTPTPPPWQWVLSLSVCSNLNLEASKDLCSRKLQPEEAEVTWQKLPLPVIIHKMSSWWSRQIFPSLYLCSQYQMDDGKSIRYKDLYALFEHILEKSMRQEQRDWSESPVKVWVNTFKVFLDEFMTEYKPMEGTIGRVRKLITAYRDWKKSKKYNRRCNSSFFSRTFGLSCTSVPL